MFTWFKRKAEPSKYELVGRYTFARRPVQPVVEQVPVEAAIPDAWRPLPAMLPADRVALMLSLMSASLGQVLPGTLAYLQEFCTDAELAVSDGRYFIIYTVSARSGSVHYYVGGNPMQPSWPQEVNVGGIRQVRGVWNVVPEPLKSFYEHTHDGFYDFMSQGLGLSGLDQVHCLGDYLVGDPWYERYAGSYTFYSHLSGAVLCLDIDGPQPGRADMWWGDSEPELDVDFWSYLDEAILDGINPPDSPR